MPPLSSLITKKTAPGLALLASFVAAIVAVNSPLNTYYSLLKFMPVVFQAGSFIIDKPFLMWINDGLMAIFFLLVGLEIKRELIEGHLSSPAKAALPAVAAAGGVLFPAFIYAFFNWGDDVTLRGWAIPTATDIAFAYGALTLLGKRVPDGLKVCLVAVAIIDDIIAVAIIAFFYTDEISLISISLALGGLALLVMMNRKGVTSLVPYICTGLFIWACVLKSGVHATIAGILLGLVIPLRAKNEDGKSPLRLLEAALHPFVGFFVVPLFCFVNAGISLEGISLETLSHPVTLGIMAGLFFGKQAGIMGFTRLGTALKICRLPEGINWQQYYGIALLAGVGFTMSMFIATLAFTDIKYFAYIRLGVISGSLLSAAAGVYMLVRYARKERRAKITTKPR